MPLPVIADVIRTSVEGLEANGHEWANVLHFRKTPILSYSGAIAILDPLLLSHYTVNNGAGLSWKTQAPSVSSLQRFRYTPLDGITASTVNTHISVGSAGIDSLPANVALVVTLRTANRGRSYRGRTYQTPFNENANDAGGTPSAPTVAGTATQWTNFLTSLAGSGLSLVVASYFHALATDVTTCTVDSRWDSQRRRLR